MGTSTIHVVQSSALGPVWMVHAMCGGCWLPLVGDGVGRETGVEGPRYVAAPPACAILYYLYSRQSGPHVVRIEKRERRRT
jgi:hypothetical protein